MRPLVRAALLVTAAAILARAAHQWSPREAPAAPGVSPSGNPALPPEAAPCPPGTLPDQGACVPVPAREESALPGRWDLGPSGGEAVPLLPGRPSDPGRYRWPMELPPEGLTAPSPPLEPPSPVAVALRPESDGEVRVVALEQQVGDAQLLWSGELLGRTVVTLHTVRTPSGLRRVALLHGGLVELTAGLARGANIARGTRLGAVAPSGRLLLEAREIRRGVEASQLAGDELRQLARTIPIDLRNLLEQR